MQITKIERLAGKSYDIEQRPNADDIAGFVDSIKESTVERYRITTDSRFYTAIRLTPEAQATNLVPIQNVTKHPDDDTLICRRIRLTQELSSPLHWIYEATYEYDSEEEESPLDRPAEYEWDTNFRDEAQESDLEGTLYLNSAGDRPDRPIVERIAYPLAIVTKNVEPFPDWYLDIGTKQGRVINETQVGLEGMSVDPEHANLLSVKLGPLKVENEVEYRVAQFRIEVSEKKYSQLLLDEGMRQKKSSTERVHILGADQQPVTAPVPLNGLGEPLVPNLSVSPPLTAVYLPFVRYYQYDFNNLPLE